MKILEQRVLNGPSLCCGRRCIQTRVDLGELASAVTSDFPGFDAGLLSVFPAMRDFEEALARGTLMAEVIGRVALELQRLAGAQPARTFASGIQGKQAQVTIVVTYQIEKVALMAIDRAIRIVGALAAGARFLVPASVRQRVSPARQFFKANEHDRRGAGIPPERLAVVRVAQRRLFEPQLDVGRRNLRTAQFRGQ
jgi:hypothetical protein